jgi:tetratricopeptide (TPR) repeat protein
MLSLAQKNQGKAVKIAWQVPMEPEFFTLEVVIQTEGGEPARSPENRWSAGKEKGRSEKPGLEYKEPRWTLTKETRLSEQEDGIRLGERPVTLWSHASGDVELILNLIPSQGAEAVKPKVAILPTQFETTAQMRALSDPINPTIAAESSIPDFNSRRPSVSTVENVFQSVSLAGKLSEMDLSAVFQSIMLCKMTGCLNIQSTAHSSEIFFDEGALTHARLEGVLSQNSTSIIGDQALLNVLTWDEGTFMFQKERKTSERTVKRRLEGLLLEGASLRDYHKYLVSLGITEDSILSKRDANLSEEQFDAKVADGVPIDPNLQKSVYQAIDGSRMLCSVFENLNLSRNVWTPILFNLISCDLIALKTSSIANITTVDMAIPIDQISVKEAAKTLVRSETGLCSFPLATHFLEQEIARLGRSQSHLTVVVFELKQGKDVLSNEALQQLADSFNSFKEKFDLLAHYKVFDFVMLLPLRTEEQARELVNKFFESIKKWGLDGFTPNNGFSGHFGITSTGSVKTEAIALLVEAEKTKIACKQKGLSILTGRELRWEALFNDGLEAAGEKRLMEAETALTAAREEAKCFGKNDARFLQSIQRLAEVNLEQQKYPQAVELLEQLLVLKEQAEGSKSVEFALTAGELARACYLRGNYDQSEKLLREVIDVYTEVHGEGHLVTANSLHNLATVYLVQNKLDEATPLLKEVLKTKSSLLGAEHPDVQQIANQFEKLLKEQDRNEFFATGSFKAYRPSEGL